MKYIIIKYKERITCSCSILDKCIFIVGTKYKKTENEFSYDIIIYKLSEYNTLIEVKRFSNAHNQIINAIIYLSGKIFSCSEDKTIKIWNK